AAKKTVVEGRPAPDANDEYQLYQTLLGAWPGPGDCDMACFRERIGAYLLKAIKEAKVHTSWVNPNAEYEKATRDFVARLLTDGDDDTFLLDIAPMQKRVAHFGWFNSLSQLVLKMTCPGVADFYQGSELWVFALVDPDNRRPVDFTRRTEMLAALKKQ